MNYSSLSQLGSIGQCEFLKKTWLIGMYFSLEPFVALSNRYDIELIFSGCHCKVFLLCCYHH